MLQKKRRIILDVELTDLVRFEELKRGRMKKEEIQALFSQFEQCHAFSMM